MVSINIKLSSIKKELADRGCSVIRCDFISHRIKSIYCDKVIAVNSAVTDEKELLCVLTQQLGNDYLSRGFVMNDKKQAAVVKEWASDRLVGISGLVEAFENGCKTLGETADYLFVTEQFLNDALACYSKKYGKKMMFGTYRISFAPNFEIEKAK